MTHEQRILEAGRLMQPVLLDPSVPERARQKIHDAMNNLTAAIIFMDKEPDHA